MSKLLSTIFVSGLLICGATITQAIETVAYYGNYQVKDKQPWLPCSCLQEAVVEPWAGVTSANENYKIGILVPHLKDGYWLSINYGIIERAKELGVSVKFLSAGSYRKGGIQRKQLTDDLIKEKVNGIIIAPIYYDKLDRFISQVSNLSIPIISMVNDILAPDIRGKIMSSPYDIGYTLGKYIIRDADGKDINIAFFLGPKEVAWTSQLFESFMQSIKDNVEALPIGRVAIVSQQYARVTPKLQSQLVDHVLNSKEDLDYIIANGVAAKEAVEVLKKHKNKHPTAKIIATYLLPDLYKLIEKSKIAAAVTDLPRDQGIMALDMMVRILNGENTGDLAIQLPFRASPKIVILDKENLSQFPLKTLFVTQENAQPIMQYIKQ